MNQDESSFENEFGAVLRSVQQDREACPDNVRLIAWHAGELAEDESARLADHVAACAECSALVAKLEEAPEPVDDLTWARARRSLDRRQWPWQPRGRWKARHLGLVAAGIAAVAVTLVWFQPSAPPEIAPATRSATPLTVLGPSGTVSQLEFRWQAMPIHHAYVVEIAREGREIASLETFRPPLPADAKLLERLESGTPYRWRVIALDASGRKMAESEWTEFQLRD